MMWRWNHGVDGYRVPGSLQTGFAVSGERGMTNAPGLHVRQQVNTTSIRLRA